MYITANNKGCFLVALEGADRTGKATQARLLDRGLKLAGYKSTVEEIPYNDKVTYPEIYRMLQDGTVNSDPAVFQTLHAINRRHFQTCYLPELANQFDVIILDRWNLSTRVYGKASGLSEQTTENTLKGIIEADIAFVLDGAPFPKENLDVWESDSEFQQAVRQEYTKWCQKSPQKYVLIDANRSKEQVHEQILEYVKERLK